jgi:hypothetical protein
MKFYKRQTTDLLDPMGSRWAIETDGRIVTDTTNSLETPRGNAIERPGTPVLGSIRFNTDIGDGGELEVYVRDNWEIIKTNRHATVTQQEFDNGDYADTIFGPLAYDIDPSKPENLTVYVENVWQIPNTNYTLFQSTVGAPLTKTTYTTLDTGFGDTVLHLASVADFNVGVAVYGTNLNGNIITATSATDRTITIFPGALGFIRADSPAIATYDPGTYIVFEEAATPVPFKPVIALLGLDGYCPPFEV